MPGDFETMPIGTLDVMREAAAELRAYEAHYRKHAVRLGSPYARSSAVKAGRLGGLAGRLEAKIAESGR